MKSKAILTAVLLTATNVSANCLDEVASFAERICGEIEEGGTHQVIEASGELKAEVTGILRKVVGDAGGSIDVKHLTESWESVLREDLAGERFSARECRIKMVEVGRNEACIDQVAVPPPPVCTYVSIRSLGWRSGHKTNFCKANGYPQGNFNQGDYKNGGICMAGDASICKASVLGQLSTAYYCQPEANRTVCYEK